MMHNDRTNIDITHNDTYFQKHDDKTHNEEFMMTRQSMKIKSKGIGKMIRNIQF